MPAENVLPRNANSGVPGVPPLVGETSGAGRGEPDAATGASEPSTRAEIGQPLRREPLLQDNGSELRLLR